MLARPVVGIAQSASGFNNCHRHFPADRRRQARRARAAVCRSTSTISLGEVFLNPTSMMFRNLHASTSRR